MEAYDVVVAGGGPAGIGAAVSAARNGAKVLLIEQTNRLGGMGTNGVVPILKAPGDAGGIFREWIDRLAELESVHETVAGPDAPGYQRGRIDANTFVAAIVAAQMLTEAGGRILFHTFANGVEMDGRRLTGVVVSHKGGREVIRTRAAVDCTGNGDLAAWAGAPFEKGGEHGRLQAVSLNFQVLGVDESRTPDGPTFRSLVLEAIDRGEVDLPRIPSAIYGGARFPVFPAGVLTFQFDVAVGIDASDPWRLSEGERICHERVLGLWRFLRRRVPGFEECVLGIVAPLLGVRETRRIRGEATLAEADVRQARKHPDGICRAGWYMDVHDGQHKDEAARTAMAPPKGDFYEIPYGCLVPREVDNLLVAGRCISSTRWANGAMRIQPTCMNTGQAAGLAAARCAREGRSPRSLSGVALREDLAGQGMDL